MSNFKVFHQKEETVKKRVSNFMKGSLEKKNLSIGIFPDKNFTSPFFNLLISDSLVINEQKFELIIKLGESKTKDIYNLG